MNDSPLSDNEYRALARFRFALRTFLPFSGRRPTAWCTAPLTLTTAAG